jgi:hypothetical protein
MSKYLVLRWCPWCKQATTQVKDGMGNIYCGPCNLPVTGNEPIAPNWTERRADDGKT